MLHWRQSDQCSLAYKNVWLCMMLDTFAVRQTTQLGLPKWSAAFPSINNSRVATSLPRMLLWWNIHSAAEWWVRSLSHYNNITWASWHLKSTATLFHVKQLLQAQKTDETSEPRITGSLWGNPRGNPTVTGGFFSRRMMTSSNGKKNPRDWPFVQGIPRSTVDSLHKGQWHGALMYSLICAWINSWVNNQDVGDLRRHGAHHCNGKA